MLKVIELEVQPEVAYE